MALRILAVTVFLVGSVLSEDCPTGNPFLLLPKGTCNTNGGDDCDKTFQGKCLGQNTEKICCVAKRDQLPELNCPNDKQFAKYQPKQCANDDECGAGTVSCVEGTCCFSDKKDGFDDGCTADKPWRGLACKDDKDCDDKQGAAGACSNSVCCYEKQPAVPEAGCKADKPYSITPKACKADTDCTDGEGPQCVFGMCCYEKKKEPVAQCPADNPTPSTTKKACKDGDNTECNEDGKQGVCANSLCCYPAEKTTNGGPSSSSGGKVTPICPDDKPFVRSLCTGGRCAHPGDVCHLNYACCYGYGSTSVVNPPSIPAPAPYRPQPRPVNTCRDVLSECSLKSHLCALPLYKDFMAKNCAKTCNMCNRLGDTYPTNTGGQYPYSAGSSHCRDANQNCPRWVANGFCHNDFYTKSLKRNLCAYSCNLC
uniref:ShKT domain-containing protein n=1 Tax=Steinernema glaseri TaxID=37863 RepID=A0A1I8AA33_9BILA